MALRKNQTAADKPVTAPVLLAYSSVLFFITGVALWVAGHAYLGGYWSAARLPGIIEPVTLQETMYAGFLSIENWIWAFFISAVLFFLIFISSIKERNRRTKVAATNFIFDWIQKRYYFNTKNTKLVASAGSSVLAFILIIMGTALWLLGADAQGGALFRKQACQILAGGPLPTTLVLDKGGNISGRTIFRTDNLTVLMTPQGLYLVDLRGTNKISERLDFPEIDCKVEFPEIDAKKNVKK